MSTCPYAKPKIESNYSWSDSGLFVSRASAQAATQYVDQTNNVYNPSLDTATLPVPLLFVLLMFCVFVTVISLVYIYHWTKFSLGDKFIERGVYIYLLGLLILSIPLIIFVI
jgi:hypothetical protein